MPGTPETLQRQIIKTLLLKAINATDRKTAFSSFRQDWRTGHMAKHLTNDDLSRLVDVNLERHPFMTGKLCSDSGIGLMYTDSRITDDVLTNATRHYIPVLGVHDSFIVDFRRVRALKLFMRAAAERIVGVNLPVKTTHPDPDTILSRVVTRSRGYTQRLAEHVSRNGPLAVVKTPG